MNFLNKKITITQVLLVILVPVSLGLYIVYHSIIEQSEIRKIYSKCRLIEPGMKISRMYEILDTDISSEVQIEYNSRSKSYRHYIIFPTPLNTEFTLKIEFDKDTHTVINFDPNSCP